VFSENAASDALQFTDANTNTLFSLVPEVLIDPGATVPLKYDATFNNNVLHLADGTPVRAEIIVSFGNHGPHGASAADVDINGNGVIDPDEAHVRSVPARLGLAVPAQTGAPTLSDALADITSTGTVTLSNASFNLGATTGTVSIHYDPGTDGGDVTNCAHLTGGGGLDLQACNTQSVTGTGGGGGCTDGAPGCGWTNGDVTTFTQQAWDGDVSIAPANVLLANQFANVYPSGLVEVGISGTAGFSMIFTDVPAILAYLPQTGAPAALTADLLDPTSSSSGAFGAEVLALKVNVDFGDAGLMGSFTFGNLTICGVSDAVNGQSVRQFEATANTLLGGGTASLSIADASTLANELNGSFFNGTPSSFAQQHLVNGACP
jgi:hypothetical protein